MRSTRVPGPGVRAAVRLPAVPTASMRPPCSRTSTVRPSVSRAPDSRSEPWSAGPEGEGEWGGCGWLSGIALLWARTAQWGTQDHAE